jgi:hypothetical protein
MVPVMAMQGKMEDKARASRQFLANAKVKPVTNAARKLTATGTFSDTPRWIKSSAQRYLLILPCVDREKGTTNGCLSECEW